MFQTCMLHMVTKPQSPGLFTFSSLAWDTEQGRNAANVDHAYVWINKCMNDRHLWYTMV